MGQGATSGSRGAAPVRGLFRFPPVCGDPDFDKWEATVDNLIDFVGRLDVACSQSHSQHGPTPGQAAPAAPITGAHDCAGKVYPHPPLEPHVARATSHVSVESSSPRPTRDAWKHSMTGGRRMREFTSSVAATVAGKQITWNPGS
jgi:hypothetical protein